MPGFEVTPLSPTLGAEVMGLDLREAIAPEDLADLEAALLEHLVLFFRAQPLSPDQLLARARQFGEVEAHAFGPRNPQCPEVGVLDQSSPQHDGANRWHCDSTFMPRPPRAVMLRAESLPALGGDTCWASMYAAYEALNPALRATLETLSATHDVTGPLRRAVEAGHSVGDLETVRAEWPLLSHPVICRHPETQRPLLYVNSNFSVCIDELEEAESEALLTLLFEWVRNPDFQLRFRWEEDCVALWDNRCTQHFAVADYRERRVMHRVAIADPLAPQAVN